MLGVLPWMGDWLAVGLALLLAACALVFRMPTVRTLRGLFVFGTAILGLALVVGANWSGDDYETTARVQFETTLLELEDQARRIATRLSTGSLLQWTDGESTDDAALRFLLFSELQEAIEIEAGPGNTVFVVDGDGVADAWAGIGLRNALPESELPTSGPFSLNSFTATTLGFVDELPELANQRIVVGASYSSFTIPDFIQAPGWLLPKVEFTVEDGEGRIWAVEDRGDSASVSDGDAHSSHSQSLVLHPRLELKSQLGLPSFVVLALLLVLFLDLAVVWLRGSIEETSRAQLAEPTPPLNLRDRLPLTLLPMFALAAAAALALMGSRHLSSSQGVAGLAFVAIGTISLLGRPRTESSIRTRLALGGIGAVAVGLVILWLELGRAPSSGASALVGSALFAGLGPTFLGLLSWVALTVILARGSSRVFSRASLRSWMVAVGFGLVLLAHAIPQSVASNLSLFAATLLPLTFGGPVRARSWAAFFVTTAILSASWWTLAQDRALSRDARVVLHPTESSFAQASRQSLAEELNAFFENVSLDELSLGLREEESRAEDLALLLWLASPLSDLSGPSAVRLSHAGRSHFFGFGLEERVDGTLELENPSVTAGIGNWLQAVLVRGAVSLVESETSILTDALESDLEGPVVEFFALPFPRMATPEGTQSADLGRRLLLGGVAVSGVYSILNSSLAVGPWEGRPVIVLGSPLVRTQIPADPAETSLRRDDGRPRLVSEDQLPEQWFEESFTLVRLIPAPNPGLERGMRTAVQVTSNLILGVGLLVLVGALVVGRGGVLGRLLGPFSRRLIMVFAVLASAPIVLLTVLLLRSFSDRISEAQRLDGEAALSSAERMVGDYLSSLDPGFSLTGVLDDDLLSWISLIVQHEVNLYWRGTVLTSSKPELFSAGLLSSQIPGDVFASMDLLERNSAARYNQSEGGTRYLELYRRVELPGDTGRFGLYVSVPLLAQELEITKTLQKLLNQALVLATLLTLLLVAVAIRFADGLTKPITAMVTGTRRIADGAPSLGERPRIPELRHLAQSIDEMAQRIASGRERLIREKRVVDTVIANINSAVVSFGEDGKVIMANREAADLLGARAGDSLEQLTSRLSSRELAEVVGRKPSVAERSSVRLEDEGESGEEWTVQWLPIAGQGDPAALLVLEDVTEVLRAQRLAAWAEMARIIAHEVKNPLTPIRLSADHLRRVYETSPEALSEVFDQCIDNILAQVEELRLTAEEFSTYSRIPISDKSIGDLRKTAEEVFGSYRSGASDHLRFTADLAPGEYLVEHDRRLIGRVLRNLFENAIRACEGSGRVHLELVGGAELGGNELVGGAELGGNAGSAPRSVRLTVSDDGPGVSPGDLHRIFEPTFSASTGGTGLGLPIAKSIIEDHGGTIEARNLSRGLDPHLGADSPQAPASQNEAARLRGLQVSISLPIVSNEH